MQSFAPGDRVVAKQQGKRVKDLKRSKPLIPWQDAIIYFVGREINVTYD